jgi:hypothetical protein
MLQLNDISDFSGGLRSIERQLTAVTAATCGKSLPLPPSRPIFNEETTCL